MATTTLPVTQCLENKPWLKPGTEFGNLEIVGFETKGSKQRVAVKDIDKPAEDYFTCHTDSTTVEDFKKAMKSRLQRLKTHEVKKAKKSMAKSEVRKAKKSMAKPEVKKKAKKSETKPEVTMAMYTNKKYLDGVDSYLKNDMKLIQLPEEVKKVYAIAP